MARLLRRRVMVTLAGALVVSAVAATTSLGDAAAAGPTNTALPAVTGTAVQGQTLQATQGVWTSTGALTYAYQWRRCDAAGNACSNILNATTQSYVLGSADVGDTLRVAVTATDSTGSTTATSAQTGVVASSAPASDQPPTISGTPREGQTLTANEGQFTGATPIAFTYGWQRCDATGGACVAVPGAVTNRYQLVTDDVDRTMRAQVTATNAAGTATATTVPTAAVEALLPAGATRLPGGKVSIPASSATLPARLVIDKAEFTPNPVRSRALPITLRVHVSDTRGYVVRDARVFALGVPYSRVSTPDEVATAADGWATLRFTPEDDLQLVPGGYLVVFLRARVEGDKLTAGATAHRLVQVRTGPPA